MAGKLKRARQRNAQIRDFFMKRYSASHLANDAKAEIMRKFKLNESQWYNIQSSLQKMLDEAGPQQITGKVVIPDEEGEIVAVETRQKQPDIVQEKFKLLHGIVKAIIDSM